MSRKSDHLTELLNAQTGADSVPNQQVYELVYLELRRIAARQLKAERDNHTLQPSALVNEAWIKLCEGKTHYWNNRLHFLAFAAQVMRHILVDYGRRRNSVKRGVNPMMASLDSALNASLAVSGFASPISNIDIDRALRKLKTMDARQAHVVELRFFGGLTEEETAELLGVSSRTIKRDWNLAKAWLHGELKSNFQVDRAESKSCK
jgi:RNA polymerase sigma-70 factor (ECF subfamily)